MMWGYDGFGYGGVGMGIGMLLFWGLIIAAIVALARGLGGTSDSSAPRARDRTPLDILGERYAKGEIDKAEFAERGRDLEGSGTLTMDTQRREFLNPDGVKTA